MNVAGDIPARIPAPGQPLTEDLTCTRCGYNLRGLTLDKLCPECATPIARSIHGNLLRYADPEWLDKLRLGAELMLWSILIGVVLGVAAGLFMAFMTVGLPQVFVSIVFMLTGVLGLWAMFLITTPEPAIAFDEDPVTLRKVVRWCAVANFLGTAVQQAAQTGGLGTAVVVAGRLLEIIGLVAYIGQFMYLRRLARRIPDEKLARQTMVVMWGYVGASAVVLLGGVVTILAIGGLTAVGGSGTGPAPVPGTTAASIMGPFMCLGGLGLLVFGIWSVVLLLRYHGALKNAVAQARQSLLNGTAAFAPES